MSCQNRNQNLWNCHSTGVDLPHLIWPNMHCQNRNQNLWNCSFNGVGLDLPHLVCQIWAVRIGIKICEIVILWGGGRSATPGLPNMRCQSRNQNLVKLLFYMGWGRSATPGLPNMHCQNRNQNLWNCHSNGVGLDLPHLVCQIWAVRIGIKIWWNCCSTGVDLPHLVSQIWAVRIGIKICEIAVLQRVDLPHLVCQIWAVRIGIKICEIAILWGGGRSATPDLPNMSCQNRNQNLWNCYSNGVWLDLPHLVCQIWAVRIGIKICEIAILWGGGRSATPGQPNMQLLE